jgi:hypothetical protein
MHITPNLKCFHNQINKCFLNYSTSYFFHGRLSIFGTYKLYPQIKKWTLSTTIEEIIIYDGCHQEGSFHKTTISTHIHHMFHTIGMN